MRMTVQESPLAKYGFVPLNQSDVESSESVQPEQSTQTQPTNKESPLTKYGFTPLEQPAQPTQTQEGKKIEDEYSAFQRLAQFGRGMTNTYTGLNDLINQYVIYYGAKGIEKGLEAAGLEDAANTVQPYAEAAGESQTLKHSQEWWNEKAGKDLTPIDDTGKFLTYAGEFAAPIPIKGGKQVLDAVKGGTVKQAAGNIADMTGKNLARASGASTGMTMLDGVFSEKYEWPNAVLQLMEAVGGAALAEKAYGGAKGRILQALGKTAYLTEEQLAKMSAKEAQQQKMGDPNFIQKGIGKVLSKAVKKDDGWDELIKAAKEEGVDLPFNVALGGGKFKNLLANNIFKSMFTNKIYNDVITNADQAMVNGLKEVIESVHPAPALRGQASDTARSFLKNESEAVMKEQKQLYDHAEILIKPEDKVSIAPFIEKADKILKSMSDSPSGARAIVYNKILDIYKKWGLLSKADQKVADELSSWVGKLANSGDATIPQHIIDSVSNIGRSNKKDAQILASKVENLRKDWNQLYDPAKVDFSKMFGSLTGGLKESLKTSTNKEYINAVFAADKFHEVNVANRIRTDMAQSLMKGEVPKEAFQYMDSPQRVRQLSHIMGESPQAKDIMQSLKRAKLNEILYEKAVDGGSTILTETGHIKYGALANNLIKSSNVELVKELLDPEAFQQLQRLARISRGMHQAGREVGTNTSVTGIASSDIGQFKKMLDAALGSLDAFVGGGAALVGGHAALTGSPLMGITSALAYPASIWGFSKILGHKKIIDAAIEYAQASVKNDSVKMRSILKELSRRASGILTTEEGQLGLYNYKARELNERTEKRKKEKALS